MMVRLSALCTGHPGQRSHSQVRVPAGLMTTFYCPRFETPPNWSARSLCVYPPGTGYPSYIPRHWVPYSLPPTTRGSTVEVFDPTSTRVIELSLHFVPLITPRHGPLYKTPFPTVPPLLHVDLLLWGRVCNCYLVMGLSATILCKKK
jgi:hypothetical protein